MSVPNVISLVAFLGVFVCTVTFIVLNHMWTQWRHNPWGRHVMLFSYVISVIMMLAVARLVFGDYWGREWLLAVFYSAFFGVMVQRVWLVVREHRGRLRSRR